MKEKNLLVIIPHSSTNLLPEIKKNYLSKEGREMIYSRNAETDWFSEKLYNFCNILGNEQIIFPYSQVFLNVCRNPKYFDSSVPTKIRGISVFKKNFIPTVNERKKFVEKYSLPFYQQISNFKGKLIFNGHTTIPNHSSLNSELKYDIALSSFFIRDGKKVVFAPEEILLLYANELKKRFPNLRIGINDLYLDVYEYICDKFGWKGEGSSGIPIIHQETNEELYFKKGIFNEKELDKLRKGFADALNETLKKYNSVSLNLKS